MKDYGKRFKRSKTRLTKIEEKKALKQAFIFIFLSALLLIVLLFIGLPMLTKISLLISGLKSSGEYVETKKSLSLNPPEFLPLFEATNSSPISIKGISEPDNTIKIILNGESIKELKCNPKGEFQYLNLALRVGKNLLKAKAIDKDSNESEYSEELTIILDHEKPALTVNSPQDGSRFFDKERNIQISGTTDPDASLSINERLVVIDFQGNFDFNYELSDGENVLKIISRDLAGNEEIQVIKVTYSP